MYTLRERAEWIFAFSEIASHLLPTKRSQINYQIDDLIFEFQECYTLPDFDGMTDTIHPITGLTTYGGKSEADVRKEHPTILRMTTDAFCQKKAELQNALAWIPTDKDRYYEALGCFCGICKRVSAYRAEGRQRSDFKALDLPLEARS